MTNQKYEPGTRTTVTFGMSVELKKKLAQAALDQRKTQGEIAEEAIAAYLERKPIVAGSAVVPPGEFAKAGAKRKLLTCTPDCPHKGREAWHCNMGVDDTCPAEAGAKRKGAK